jgi:type I restriction enzyme S subunit
MTGEGMAVPDIDIRPEHWVIVAGILRNYVPHYDVWAFGSRAKGTAKPFSDLDLAVIAAEPLALDLRAALADEFTESDLPWKVDVVDWASTSDVFREVIKRDKVVVQTASE